MEKIHGIKTIKRRKYTIQRDYTECKEILAEDFQQMCGYCGKDRKVLHLKVNFQKRRMYMKI